MKVEAKSSWCVASRGQCNEIVAEDCGESDGKAHQHKGRQIGCE